MYFKLAKEINSETIHMKKFSIETRSILFPKKEFEKLTLIYQFSSFSGLINFENVHVKELKVEEK